MAHYGVRGGGSAGDGSWGKRVETSVVLEFEDYDQTPYGGGYDIIQVYGRPLPPSEETCYPTNFAASNAGQPRPSAYAGLGKKAPEPHAYGPPRGGFRKPSYPKPQPDYGFHPQQVVETGVRRGSLGYGGGAQPKFDYRSGPGAPKPGSYEQRRSGLGSYGYTGSGPSHGEEVCKGYGYGQGYQTGGSYPPAGNGPGCGYVEGSGHKWPQDHGRQSGYMEQVYRPVSSFGREPLAYGQMERR